MCCPLSYFSGCKQYQMWGLVIIHTFIHLHTQSCWFCKYNIFPQYSKATNFLATWTGSIVSIVPYMSPVSNTCYTYPEFCSFAFVACLCSLNLLCKVLPACQMYSSGQLWHLNLYTPLQQYGSVTCFLCFFFLEVRVNYVFSNNFVIILVSLPVYINVTYFFHLSSSSSFFYH
jgi:hypothetical protein